MGSRENLLPPTQEATATGLVGVMAPTRSKISFAIGLFQSGAALRNAFEALVCSGIEREHVEVLSFPAGRVVKPKSSSYCSAMGDRFNAGPNFGRAVTLLSNAEPDGLVFDLLLRIAHDEAAGCLRRSDVEQMSDRWSLARQSRRLHRHLVGGGQTLVVRLKDRNERDDVCALLLKHADQGLQTHELRMPN